MNFIVVAIAASAVFAIAVTALLAYEQRDKERRRAQGLPPKKYHDITDYDVTIIDTIRYK